MRRPTGIVLAALTAICAAAIAVRAATLPGLWGVDDFFNVELVLGHAPLVGGGDREFRLLFLGLLRAGLWIGGERPWGAVAGVLAVSLTAIPLTWLAGRRLLGDALALLPAALVAAVPVFFFETTQPSNDGPMAAFGAALMVVLPRATDADPRARRRALVLAGICLGLGAVFKEIFLLAAIPAAAWLGWQTVRGRVTWRGLALSASAAAALVVLDRVVGSRVFAGTDRMAVVSAGLAQSRSLATFGGDVRERLLLGPLLGMTTDLYRWGAFYLAGAAALLLAATGAKRAHPAVWIALGAPIVLWFLPVSFTTFALLPVSQPRYLLSAVPATAIACFLPFTEEPPSRARAALPALASLVLVALSRNHPATAAAVAAAALALLAAPGRIGAVPAACCFAAAVFTSFPAYGDGPLALAAWAFLVPVAAALLVRSRPWAVPAATATALVVSLVAGFAAAAPVRARTEARWALRADLENAGRVFAEPEAFRTLRIAGGSAKSPWLAPWTDEDRLARRLPPNAAPGDTLVLWNTPPRDAQALATALAEARPDLSVTLERRPGGTLLKLSAK